jgi:hypothetical protein
MNRSGSGRCESSGCAGHPGRCALAECRLSLGLECAPNRDLWHARIRAFTSAAPGAGLGTLDGPPGSSRIGAAQYPDSPRNCAAPLAVDAAQQRTAWSQIGDLRSRCLLRHSSLGHGLAAACRGLLLSRAPHKSHWCLELTAVRTATPLSVQSNRVCRKMPWFTAVVAPQLVPTISRFRMRDRTSEGERWDRALCNCLRSLIGSRLKMTQYVAEPMAESEWCGRVTARAYSVQSAIMIVRTTEQGGSRR